MNPPDSVNLSVDNGIAHLTLNRPERHNAFDDHMISVLDDRLREIADRGDVRAVILAAEGK
ncbi:MAG: hypothetical protein HOM58_07215, partial [Rhodospirillaceae bacterium]|nr:hypothetical protein [Rhodospirillaceae bacterium]